MNRAFQAVGFDLGETLAFSPGVPLDWTELYERALLCLAEHCGYTVSAEVLRETEAILMRYNTRIVPRVREVTADEVLGSILDHWGLAGLVEPDEASVSFFSFFRQQLQVYPETIAVLQRLRERGIKTGVLTDVPYGMGTSLIRQDLEALGVLELVDVLLASGDVGWRKPERVGFLELCARLRTEPNATLYVGNEPKDVEGANRAGLFSVLLDRDRTGASFGQRATITTLKELEDLL